MNYLEKPWLRFLIRWLVCSLGLYVAASFLSDKITYGDRLWTIIMAGLILAIINTFIRPVLVILSLPAIVLTLGLFMILVNGLTVYLASILYKPLHVTNFWAAVFAGIMIGLINYLVSAILKELND
ncbi:phage holin family protein [bacterium]|jgi:putative membrane protein|nr:phage holin family protein [bacterium]